MKALARLKVLSLLQKEEAEAGTKSFYSKTLKTFLSALPDANNFVPVKLHVVVSDTGATALLVQRKKTSVIKALESKLRGEGFKLKSLSIAGNRLLTFVKRLEDGDNLYFIKGKYADFYGILSVEIGEYDG